VDAQGVAERARYAADGAFGIAEAARAREEDAWARERVLALRLRVAEEEGRMMDRAVGEYADLVRALERRQSLPSSPPPPPPPKESPAHPASASNGKHAEKYGGRVSTLEALRERKEELRKLAGEFEGASEVLRDEIGKLRGELDEARAELEAERKAAEEERARLSNALTELELLKHDDNAAAKMVSRYMYAQSRSSHRLPYQNVPPPHALGSSHKPQRTRYKSRSSLSPRAT
jgi:DNA repair exonuclease SbcCD ATPase subunit